MLILIGHNDTPYLTNGWHPTQEGPAGVPCRWISQRAELMIPATTPLSTPSSQLSTFAITQVAITVSAPASIRDLKPGLSLYLGERLLGHCPDLGPEGHWATDIFDVNLPASAEPLTLTLAIENREADPAIPLAFIPHETLNNGDLRELGALISTIRLGH